VSSLLQGLKRAAETVKVIADSLFDPKVPFVAAERRAAVPE
jgi:hypothetical protein